MLSVAGWNIGPAKASDLGMLTDLAAVLGFQEGSDQKSTLKGFCERNPGWLLYVGWRPGAAAVPVLVNTAVVGLPFTVTFHKAVGRRWVGPKGAGPTFSKPKWITHVELADGTHILNTHMIPSATRSRRAFGKREWLARRKHYRDHIAAIVAIVETIITEVDPFAKVVLTLDLNAPPEFELVKPLHDVGFTGWTTEPTMHGKPIDHVLHLRNPKFIETAQMVLNTTSDHKAVVAAFEYAEEPTVPAPPYDRSIFHGRLLDNATINACQAAEGLLGYELTIVQGIGGAAASAGTHLEGRAVDLAAWDHENKVKVMRDLGFAAWYRPDLPGVWGEHIHCVLILERRDNSRGLADSGFRQIGSYDRGRDGLKDDGPDANTYRPKPPVNFDYPYKEPVVPPKPNNVTKARDALVEAMHALGTAAALLDNTDPSRVVARAQIDELLALKHEAKVILEALPKR